MNMGLSLMKNICYEIFNHSVVMEGCPSHTPGFTRRYSYLTAPRYKEFHLLKLYNRSIFSTLNSHL